MSVEVKEVKPRVQENACVLFVVANLATFDHGQLGSIHMVR